METCLYCRLLWIHHTSGKCSVCIVDTGVRFVCWHILCSELDWLVLREGYWAVLCCFLRPARSWRSWLSCLSWWSWPAISWTGTPLSSETTSASLSASQVGMLVATWTRVHITHLSFTFHFTWFICCWTQFESEQTLRSTLQCREGSVWDNTVQCFAVLSIILHLCYCFVIILWNCFKLNSCVVKKQLPNKLISQNFIVMCHMFFNFFQSTRGDCRQPHGPALL